MGRYNTGKKKVLSVNVDAEVFEEIDKRRGDVSRSLFTNKILRKALGMDDHK